MSDQAFKIIEPIVIDDTKIALTDLNEPAFGANADPAVWSAATAYAVGDRVTQTTTHSIYQRRVAGTTATAPENDPTNWVRVGPTNKWAMFDQSNTTQTQQNDSFTFYLLLGAADVADHIVFDNVDADSIRVVAYDASLVALGYDRTITLKSRRLADWWSYFFARFRYLRTAVFDDLPPLAGIKLSVTVFKTGGVAKVGTCVAGLSKTIGNARLGPTVGIRDYSTKDTDPFGNTTFTSRAYSKRMDVPVLVRTDGDPGVVDDIVNALAQYRATPVMWLGAGALYGSMVMFGKYNDFSVVIPGPVQSECQLQIEGLT